mmetsp:Transcript_5490/g.13768  ORF Transcript_5490/g.13768 Transcript_5490/m.13768 type:complete len:278 (+) Transcript_5490:274-1107(+)
MVPAPTTMTPNRKRTVRSRSLPRKKSSWDPGWATAPLEASTKYRRSISSPTKTTNTTNTTPSPPPDPSWPSTAADKPPMRATRSSLRGTTRPATPSSSSVPPWSKTRKRGSFPPWWTWPPRCGYSRRFPTIPTSSSCGASPPPAGPRARATPRDTPATRPRASTRTSFWSSIGSTGRLRTVWSAGSKNGSSRMTTTRSGAGAWPSRSCGRPNPNPPPPPRRCQRPRRRSPPTPGSSSIKNGSRPAATWPAPWITCTGTESCTGTSNRRTSASTSGAT